MKYFLVSLVIFIGMLHEVGNAQPFRDLPLKISYQGALTYVNLMGKTKAVKKGTYSVKFEFFNDPTGGSASFYSDTRSVTTDSKGIYVATIGDNGTGLGNITVDFDILNWLQVTIMSGPETKIIYPHALPRVQLTSVPYALGPWRTPAGFGGHHIIDYDGSVGIGTDDPGATLGVIGSISGSNSGDNSVGVTGSASGTSTTGVSGTGTIGVKGASSTGGGSSAGVSGVSTDVGGTGVRGEANSGSEAYGVWGLSASGYAGYFTGDVHYTGTLTGPSDAKLKENIQAVSSILSKVVALEPHTFNFKKGSEYADMNFANGRHYGLIAQEVEKVFPDLVSEAAHRSTDRTKQPIQYKSVNYVEMIPILVQAIKEQQSMIDQLKAEIDQLKGNR
ncbi:MAG: tail fiber domain-containing protein [Ignavibacteriae bacterium]|nr:tail fiber domain-containing protein [Ignavibacteria bacterium]MBI3363877.1 tail fiber domain-containing protein [Ignavibacteriota bacterium]